MGFNNFRIGTRLRLGFAAVLALLIIVLVINNVVSTKNQATLFKELQIANTKMELTAAMKSAQLQGVVAIRSIGLHSDVAAMNKEEDQLKAQNKIFNETRNKILALGISAEGQRIFSDIERLNKELEAPASDVISQALAFNPEAVAKLIPTKIDPIYRKQLEALNQWVALQQSEQEALLASAADSAKQLMYFLSLIGFIAVVIGLVLSHLITRSIVVPLHKAVKVAKHVAAGNLNSKIHVTSQDETGELLQALKEMDQNLASIVGQVRSSTETIASASRQITSGNQDLSSRTEHQASALEQTSAALKELTSTVQANADNAQQANTLALSASEIAVKGGDVMNQVVETMSTINDSSKKIVDIISVIDGIAFQTNILALNAAVEAARAGEQGRGFAVVASEVRSLAQRSATSAREIKTLISESVQSIEAGAQRVHSAGSTMEEVVRSVRSVTGIIGEISTASQEQTHGIGQINIAIAQMDQVTQQNAALVEQSHAAAQAMQDQAEHLTQVVSVFALGDSTSHSAGHSAGQPPAAPTRAKKNRLPTALPPYQKRLASI